MIEPFDSTVIQISRSLAAVGGRALLVGGYVRDQILGIPTKDYDLEVYGLPIAKLEEVLRGFGEVISVGRSFGVLRVKGLDCDFSIPRRDSKTGRGHRGFLVELDPTLEFAEAARRRDLTINSMGLDPLSEEVLDPHGGREDLRQGILRATDPRYFVEDSLRALRVAQFRARLEMEPDRELRELCATIDLSDLPGERIFEELRKLLLKSKRPSLGFEFMREVGHLRLFPELEAMVDVPQDPTWHPEGTVWEHTMLVLDEAAQDRSGDEAEDLTLLLGALCHDLGKPPTTVIGEDGRIRSPAHEDAGVPLTESFLGRLHVSHDLIERVNALVRYHLAPANFIQHGASAKAYRRLARNLCAAGVSARILYRVARADHFGRTTEDALARRFPAGELFLERAEELAVEVTAPADIVQGRHLLARGFRPSPWFGEVLRACRDLQDETGWIDPDQLLDAVLPTLPREGSRLEAGGSRPEERQDPE